MITLRRYLCVCALMFWQGGFTFYAAVVIPIAGAVLAPNLHLRGGSPKRPPLFSTLPASSRFCCSYGMWRGRSIRTGAGLRFASAFGRSCS